MRQFQVAACTPPTHYKTTQQGKRVGREGRKRGGRWALSFGIYLQGFHWWERCQHRQLQNHRCRWSRLVHSSPVTSSCPLYDSGRRGVGDGKGRRERGWEWGRERKRERERESQAIIAQLPHNGTHNIQNNVRVLTFLAWRHVTGAVRSLGSRLVLDLETAYFTLLR